MSGGVMLCPFCAQENGEQVVVCRACHRDIAIPLSLKAEHQDLLLKRQQLRDALDRARAGLGTGHRRFGFW
jgi:hypothetical protein